MRAKETKQARPRAVLGYYTAQIAKHRGLFVVSFLGTIGYQIAELISPLYLKQFFNTLAGYNPTPATMHHLLIIIGIIAFVSLCSWVARRTQSMAIMYLESRVMMDLYMLAFDYLLRHSYHFFTSQFSGTLTRRVSKFAGSFETIFDSAMMTFLPTALFVIGAVGILFARNHVLGIILGCWALFFVAFQIVVSRIRQPLRVQRAAQDSAMIGALSDAISNQNTVTLFSAHVFEHESFLNMVNTWRRATIRSWVADDYIWAAQGLLMVAINIGMLYGAMRYWQRGELTIGDFVLIQSYLIGAFNSLNGISRELRRLYDAFADAGEMVFIMNTPHDIRDTSRAHKLHVEKAHIIFKDVVFYFHKEKPVLSGLNLDIHGGMKVALVGPSGAGKTTITKLLLRLYDVTSGAVLIDGQNIQKVTQDSLREAIAFVPQEPILFHRSLMENIRYGQRDATDEEVIEAARKAHCHEFIEHLPDGYDTYVGERGVKLSGGERQRIAIARAILKDAPILLLDEATSSLDSESESLIQDSLQTLMQGKTVLVIAHRLSTIMKMDRIVVLDGGTVVASGTHDELLKEGGLYHKLWSIQAGGFIKDEDEEIVEEEE